MTPGPVRQVRLVLALGVRRWLNQIASGFAAQRSAKDDGVTARPPTPRRRVRAGLFLVLMGCAMTAGLLFAAWRFAERADAVAHDRPLVIAATWAAAEAEARAAKPGWQQRVGQLLDADAELRLLSPSERDAAKAAALVRLAQPLDIDQHTVQQRRAVLAAALLALGALCVVILPLGIGNADLARPDWDELWLAAQPIPARVLFAARVLQHALLNLMVWLLVPVVVATLACHAGLAWPGAVALGVVCALAWAVTASAVRLLIEVWLRQRLAHARIKNLQALFTVVGMGAMVALYAVSFGHGPLPQWFVSAAQALPWAALPTGWAAQAAMVPGQAVLFVPLGLVTAAVFAVFAVRRCAAWSRGGVIAHDGTLSGNRSGPPRPWRAMRVLGKDLLQLRRDRALLVQALVMPLLMIVLQLVLNPQLGTAAISGFHAAATFALALGGWVLGSATFALASEGQALWILAGAPQPLARAIRGKVAMWALFATGYAVLALIVIIALLPWPGPTALTSIVMILLGMPLLATVAVGIGAAATDPQSTVPNRRVDLKAAYIYMIVLGMFSLAVHAGGTHQRLAMLLILAVIAWALWQRLSDRLPYLFEPIDRPPRQVDLADGAWAAFIFLVIQGLLGAVLLFARVEPSPAMLIAFAVAGGLTLLFTLLELWRARVPDLLRAVGIRPAAGATLLHTVMIGLAAGLAAAVAMIGYQGLLGWLGPHLPAVREVLDAAQPQAGIFASWPLVVLVVICAPLCEEFIFRGLLFRGLRRDLPLVWAAVLSAAVFAIIHPSLGVIPVFGLGLACALAYARTGWLLAPVIAHAVYNGVVVLLAR